MWATALSLLLPILTLQPASGTSTLAPAPCLRAEAAAPVTPSSRPVAEDSLFPPARTDMEITWTSDTDRPTLGDVVSKYGDLTGQRLIVDNETAAYLRQPITLDRPLTIPAAKVQGFVEELLSSNNLVMSIHRKEAPRLVGIRSLQTGARHTIRAISRVVDADDVELMRRHPALLFSTVVQLPHLDVRQVSNTMRSMIVDTNTQQMLPVGNSNVMLLVGFGPSLADWVEYLRRIDALSSQGEPTSQGYVHKVVSLNHADAREIAPLVEESLYVANVARRANAPQPPQDLRPPLRFSVLPVPRLNALLITCVDSYMSEALTIIQQLDIEK